jgi:hypothetical protein
MKNGLYQNSFNEKLIHFLGAYDKDAKLPDYLEATIYNKEEAVIMVGNFADIENYAQKSQINQVTKWYKPWFYKHVETFLTLGETEEYIPLREYLLRHSDPKSIISFGNSAISEYQIVNFKTDFNNKAQSKSYITNYIYFGHFFFYVSSNILIKKEPSLKAIFFAISGFKNQSI